MANITTPSNIPAAFIDDVIAVCLRLGPQRLGEKFPKDPDTEAPKSTLTNQEAAYVFEHLTRHFWKQQILQERTRNIESQARQTASDEVGEDPFVDTATG